MNSLPIDEEARCWKGRWARLLAHTTLRAAPQRLSLQPPSRSLPPAQLQLQPGPAGAAPSPGGPLAGTARTAPHRGPGPGLPQVSCCQ